MLASRRLKTPSTLGTQRQAATLRHLPSALGNRSRIIASASPLQANMATGVGIKRQWVQLQPASNQNGLPTLRIMQWNMLADGLAQGGDFIRARPEVLEWSYRKPLIIAEVLEASADILCFQEVNHFDEIQAALAESGYIGCFFAKLQSPATKYQSPADGVAIFWKAQQLQVCERHEFHYTDSAGAPSPQGCMTVVLADQQGRKVLVATTHLKAKAGFDEIRLLQMQQLLASITSTVQRATTTSPQAASPPHTDTTASMPVIIAGDFNTTNDSKPCQLLASPPWSFQSIWDVPVQPSSQAAPAGQPASEGASCSADFSQPSEFSTWKFRTGSESKRIIDHMWFTGMKPRSRWRMLNEEECGCDGLPCGLYPSDHIALLCEFDLAP